MYAPVFNKRELLRLYVWGVPPFPDQVMCIYTLHFGYECKSKQDIQDVFYPGLTVPLVGLSNSSNSNSADVVFSSVNSILTSYYVMLSTDEFAQIAT
jgi:hypothetical protein